MIEEGTPNAALAEVWAHLPAHDSTAQTVADVRVDAGAVLPESGSYHHYEGSLTTPPCSEGVRWFVLSQPISMSAAQIKKFENAVGHNARPVQPLHGRHINGSD